MSVYFEALQSGRLHTVDYVAKGGARRALKAAKRAEAEERNAKTPYERTRRFRRLQDEISALAEARKAARSRG